MKTSTKRKAISKKDILTSGHFANKYGKYDFPEMGTQVLGHRGIDSYPDSDNTVNDVWVNNITKSRFKWAEKPEMSPPNKLTLVLTIVNVAILISLVIRNLK